jgi:hypothetical protein
MLGCVSPAASAVNDSRRTLDFANMVKGIQNRPLVRLDPREKLIQDLRQEIEGLKDENDRLREIIDAAAHAGEKRGLGTTDPFGAPRAGRAGSGGATGGGDEHDDNGDDGYEDDYKGYEKAERKARPRTKAEATKPAKKAQKGALLALPAQRWQPRHTPVPAPAAAPGKLLSLPRVATPSEAQHASPPMAWAGARSEGPMSRNPAAANADVSQEQDLEDALAMLLFDQLSSKPQPPSTDGRAQSEPHAHAHAPRAPSPIGIVAKRREPSGVVTVAARGVGEQATWQQRWEAEVAMMGSDNGPKAAVPRERRPRQEPLSPKALAKAAQRRGNHLASSNPLSLGRADAPRHAALYRRDSGSQVLHQGALFGAAFGSGRVSSRESKKVEVAQLIQGIRMRNHQGGFLF